MTTDLENSFPREDSGSATPLTSRRARVQAMLVYVAALVLWSALIGVPNDPLGVFLWIWVAMVAWNIQAPRDHHLRFPRDWWPVLLGLIIYWLTRGLTDEVGLPVHITMPIRFDEWIGSLFGSGGRTPTEVLQDAWCGDLCLRTTEARWYDLFFSTVYASHFLTGLTLAAVLWTRNRAEWVLWMRRYLSINFAALVIYVLYPMAPPWMASQDGYMGEVHRITSRGWSDIGLSRANMVLQGMGNQTAAMPSLHAGVTFLVAFYGIWRLRTPLRWLLLLYPLAMSTALVYFAEHYVIDVLAGGLLAGVVMVGCWVWESQRAGRTVTSRTTTPTG
jgi:membrane-associated phospholipid phosphatase